MSKFQIKPLPLIPHEFKNGEIISITPSLAETILTNLNYKNQRIIRLKHVETLAKQMSNNEFTQGTQISFGKLLTDNSLHLVNGQHRLKAIILSEIPIEFQILITPCKNELELNTLWRRNDRLVVPRTISDIIQSEGISEKYNLRINVAEAVFRAVLLINAKFRNTSRYADAYITRSDEARLKLCEEYWESAILFQKCTHTAPFKVKHIIYNAGVTAVGLVTLKYQPEIAQSFWFGLSENDGLAKDDPRAMYIKYLYNTDRSRISTKLENAKAVSTAWNAFYNKKSLLQFRISDGILIQGTPFDKFQLTEDEFNSLST